MNSKEPFAFRAVLAILLVGGLAALVMLLDVPQRVAMMGSGNLDRLVRPTTEATYGETVRLEGRAERPAVEVTAQAPRPVPARSAVGAHVAKGNRLLLAPVTIRNVGSLQWSSAQAVETVLMGEEGATYRPLSGVARVQGRRLLPLQVELDPGERARGVVVYEVPRGDKVTGASLTVGSGLTRTAEWSPHGTD